MVYKNLKSSFFKFLISEFISAPTCLCRKQFIYLLDITLFDYSFGVLECLCRFSSKFILWRRIHFCCPIYFRDIFQQLSYCIHYAETHYFSSCWRWNVIFRVHRCVCIEIESTWVLFFVLMKPAPSSPFFKNQKWISKHLPVENQNITRK